MRILIIDDDQVVLTMLVRMTRHLGHTPLEASNFGAGLEIVRTEVVDCILLDVTLVGVSGGVGMEALQEIHIPLILMSGLDEQSASRHLGIIRRLEFLFLPKPFGFSQMQQALEHAGVAA